MSSMSSSLTVRTKSVVKSHSSQYLSDSAASRNQEYTADVLPPSKQEIEEWHMMHRPPNEIRVVRYSFNPKLTSPLNPSAIFQDVHRVLLILKRQYDGKLQFSRPTSLYYLKCELVGMGEDDLEFDIEICRIWLLKVHGVKIKRLAGNAINFKFIYSCFCEMLLL